MQIKSKNKKDDKNFSENPILLLSLFLDVCRKNVITYNRLQKNNNISKELFTRKENYFTSLFI